MQIDIPEHSEQQRIADFLDDQVARIDNIIAARRAQQGQVSEVRASRLADIFRSDNAWPLNVLLDRSPQYGVLVPKLQDVGVPFIRVGDLDRIASPDQLANLPCISAEQSKEYSRTIVQDRDVLVSVVGSIDKAAIVNPEIAGSNVARAVAVLRPNSEVPSELLYAWTKSTQYLDQAKLATGGDTAQPTLNMGDLKKFGVGVDGDLVAAGREATSVMRSAEQEKRMFDRSIALMTEMKRSLITAAVTGEFDVSTADGSRVPV